MASEVFRLRKLPARFDRLETLQVLVDVLKIEYSDVTIASLARSVDHYSESKTATLVFRDPGAVRCIITELSTSSAKNDEWKIRVPNLDNLILDTHFLGFTPLHDPNTHTADHPFGSWQPKGPKDFMWIRDALPKSLPNLRPILYGYDTNLAKSNSFQSIFDLAISLIEDLQSKGWNLSTRKPLLFLAHSMGGLVLKQAIVSLAGRSESDSPLKTAFAGAVNFGVPNFGMEQSALSKMVEGQPNGTMVADLALDSKYLLNLYKRFIGLSHLQHSVLYWAYESRESSTVEELPNGKWSRTGPQLQMVTPYSATRGEYKSDVKSDTFFPINEDHSNMVKFTEDDPNYSLVVEKLRFILEKVRKRNYKSTPKQTIMPQQFTGHSISESRDKKRFGLNFRDTMVSLEAPERNWRFDEIEENFDSTFEWVYGSPDSKFKDWLQHGSGIFWINGKPGSGKSTLMKFIFQDRRTTTLLSDWTTEGHLCGFFFHHRGTSLQKSFEGLLRSLLVQIIRKQPSLLFVIQQLYEAEESVSESQRNSEQHLTSNYWTISRLKGAFHGIVTQSKEPLYLNLFLDALDEYEGPKEFICEFLKGISQIPNTSTKKIKICFASRPWEIFENNFNDCPQFTIQDFTKSDIRDYCIGSMISNSVPEAKFENLIPEIIARSQGVFLWVKLVVKDLSAAFHANKSSSETNILLQSLPGELHDYYTELIRRIPQTERWSAYAMLEIAVRSQQALDPEEFMNAVETSECAYYEEGVEKLRKLNASRIKCVSGTANRQSKRYCGGLIEVVGQIGAQRIQVLHQTVQDFVLDPKFPKIILNERANITFENGYSFLTKYYILELALMPSKSNILHVLIDDIAYHAHTAESTTGRSMKLFFDSIPRKFFDAVSKNVNIGISAPLGFAAFLNLHVFMVESLAQDQTSFQHSTDRLVHLIFMSFIARRPVNLVGLPKEIQMRWEELLKLVQFLLKGGYQLSQEPMILAEVLRNILHLRQLDGACDIWDDWIKLLLDSGASPNPLIPSYHYGLKFPLTRFLGVMHPLLHHATPNETKLLLSKGAQVNALDSFGLTALDHACGTVKALCGRRVHGLSNSTEAYKKMTLLIDAGGKRTKVSQRAVESLVMPPGVVKDYLLHERSLLYPKFSLQKWAKLQFVAYGYYEGYQYYNTVEKAWQPFRPMGVEYTSPIPSIYLKSSGH